MPKRPKNHHQKIPRHYKIASVKYQDTKSIYKHQYPFYISTMNRLRKNIGKQFHLQYAPPKIKYLGINLTKELNDLYKESYNH
jgi:hypothetical protein